MKYRTLSLILLVLLSYAAGFGQSSFMGLTPGLSTRADVERALGRPVREIGEALAEYKSDKETEKIFVQYRVGAVVVERIEAVYPDTVERADVVRSLRLPPRPTASRVNAKGRLEEYFSEANIVLTYAGADAGGGVSRVGYYSRELFESAAAEVPRNTQTHGGTSASEDSSAPNVKRHSTPSGMATNRSGRSTAAVTRPSAPDGRHAPTETTRPQPTADGPRRAPATESAGPGAVQMAIELSAAGGDEKEVPLSATELRRFVGRYAFISSNDDSFRDGVVELIGVRLKLRAGVAEHTLIPTGKSKLTASGQGGGDQFNFKVVGRPGAVVRFTVSGGEVQDMFFAEEKDGDMIIAVAVPKP